MRPLRPSTQHGLARPLPRRGRARLASAALRLLAQLAPLALLAALGGCREPPPPERPLPEPIRDPSWRDPQAAMGPAEPTTTIDDLGRPAQLAALPSQTVAAEPLAALQASVATYGLQAFGLVAELPLPVKAIASGVGADETWIYRRAVAGSPYGIELRLQRRRVGNLAELQAVAGEIGGAAVVASGEQAGRLWLRKPAVGPLQSWWLALPAARPDQGLATVASCSGPPAYQALVRRICLSLRREGEPAPAVEPATE